MDDLHPKEIYLRNIINDELAEYDQRYIDRYNLLEDKIDDNYNALGNEINKIPKYDSSLHMLMLESKIDDINDKLDNINEILPVIEKRSKRIYKNYRMLQKISRLI